MRLAGFAPCVLYLACAANAGATYSIVATDPARGVLGAAGTSCLQGDDVRVIYRSVAGVAVLVAQARYDGATQREAVRLTSEGQSPSAVIAALGSTSFDADAASRQYAIAHVDGAISGPSALAAVLLLGALHCVRRGTRRPRDRTRAQRPGAISGVVRRALVRPRRAERQ